MFGIGKTVVPSLKIRRVYIVINEVVNKYATHM